MNEQELRELLSGVRSGEVDLAEAVQKLKAPHFEDLGIAKVDTHRALRKGFPEVVYCEGKTTDEVVAIVDRILQHEDNLLATRASREVYEAVKQSHPDAFYNERARTITVERKPLPKKGGKILVVSAGTSNEHMVLFLATGLEKRSAGGGEGGEDITVHEVAASHVTAWLAERRGAGVLVDLKVYAALYFLQVPIS